LREIEAGKVDLEEQLVGVGELIRSAIRTIDPIAYKKSIQVKYEPTHATALIHVDRTKFRQIMLNLLSNGVKFTEPRGQISINSRINADGDLIISVKDTGIGIAPEHLHRVLRPIEQVADHLTKENEGAGLGLPIARALIELHGGELAMTSDLGAGTTVALRLPRDRVHRVAPARIHAVKRCGRVKREVDQKNDYCCKPGVRNKTCQQIVRLPPVHGARAN